MEVTLIQITKDELKDLIRGLLVDFVRDLQAEKEKENDPLLKVDDICAILKVSRITIHKWKKAGRIPFHRISNRVFFKKSEVLESLKRIDLQKPLNRLR